MNSALGLAGGKHYQKITIPIFRPVLQNFAFLGCFPDILCCSYYSLLPSGWFVIAACCSISHFLCLFLAIFYANCMIPVYRL